MKGEILARDETICTRTQQIVDDKHRADELEKELNEKIVALDEVAKGLNIELKVSEGGLLHHRRSPARPTDQHLQLSQAEGGHGQDDQGTEVALEASGAESGAQIASLTVKRGELLSKVDVQEVAIEEAAVRFSQLVMEQSLADSVALIADHKSRSVS